jgi:stearoyl-CoA desaturase (delta-9 desaturase)
MIPPPLTGRQGDPSRRPSCPAWYLGVILPAVPVGVVIGLASAVFTAVVTEVYCHRGLAHRAFRVHPVVASVLDTYFQVIVGTDPETWAAVHRLHHRYADTPLDPHSPVQRRPLTVLIGSSYLFARARRRVPPGIRRGRRILVIRAFLVAFYWALFGPVQVVTMLVVHLVGYLGIMGLVNTVGHLYGRKPHAQSPGYDVAWLAIPLLGHGYHNSHHAHPASPRTGPLDPIWPLLRLLDGIGAVELPAKEQGAASPPCCGASAQDSLDGGKSRRRISSQVGQTG